MHIQINEKRGHECEEENGGVHGKFEGMKRKGKSYNYVRISETERNKYNKKF